MAHVLLVDEEPVFIPEQVRQALPEHQVTVATSGIEGLAAIRAARPDVVLLDLGLPDRSGLEIYEDIRALDARLPVPDHTNGHFSAASTVGHSIGLDDEMRS